MLSVLGCIVYENNLYLVFLAAIVCLLGSTVFLRLVQRTENTGGVHRIGWQFLAAVAGGGSVWATHFVGMLAFEPQAPVSFDPVITVLSLVVAMVGLFVSLIIGNLRRGRVHAAVAGAFCGLSFAGMHYLGMFAYRVVGLVEWRMDYVVASILLTVVFTAAARALSWKVRKPKPFFAAVGLLVLAIIGLHFTGMTAFRVTPMTGVFPRVDSQAIMALALAIAVVAMIIVGMGAASYLIDTKVREESKAQLHHMAAHDPLTGLPNRACFRDYLENVLDVAEGDGSQVGVIAIDLNRFKEVNDTLGHAAGDEVLKTLAQRLDQSLEQGEFIARLGGDEFAAVRTFVDKEEMTAFGDKLASLFSLPMKVVGMTTAVGASMGAAVWPTDAAEPDELLNNADLAMYHAKHGLLETLCFYDADIASEVRERRQLAEDLRLALENDELEVHYQVQMALDGEHIHGYEALLRWHHPEKGSISPAVFIPIAEENGLIGPVGAWVLRRSCRDASHWLPPYRVAVNVSAVQFMDANLPNLVQEVLLETGLSPDRLELELTETALIKDQARSLHIMRQIKALGVGIALDDFGTGYSSLGTLRTFPFDKIKLDKSFIDDVGQDRQSKAIIRAILALGKSLDIPVLAEGIETSEQMELLRAEGCDEGQGFLLGRPSPNSALAGQGGPKQRKNEEAA
ncbi:putative bifunctional diguanylate cyclase/phosphodiesterase [Roseibium sp.]|uniref:putative bifunctional diguanylate cyclase/phosphodiesterase n=1 Tax=Roseibium sp. TaxID=1936156 RepID=UPI003A97CA47